jgi:hypothetical protein
MSVLLRRSVRVSSILPAEARLATIEPASVKALTAFPRPLLRNHAREEQQYAPCTEGSGEGSCPREDWEAQILLTFQNAFEVVGHVDAPTRGEIGEGMRTMYRQIAEYVEPVGQRAGRCTIQYLPVVNDEAFIELGQILFPRRSLAALTEKLSNAHSVHGLSLNEIIRSLAAVALTRWPQKVFAEAREQWKSSIQGPFERRMLHGEFTLSS